jgi:hypothetical protein
MQKSLRKLLDDKPSSKKKKKANGVTSSEGEGGNSSSEALAEMENFNKKKKTLGIPKITLNFLEDDSNKQKDEEITAEMKQITSEISSARSEDNVDAGEKKKKKEFFTAYEADRETDTTSNEANASSIFKVDKEKKTTTNN